MYAIDISSDGAKIVVLQSNQRILRLVDTATQEVKTYDLSFVPLSVSMLSDGVHAWVTSSADVYLIALYAAASEYRIGLRYEGAEFFLSSPIGVMSLATQTGMVVAQSNGEVYSVDAVAGSVRLVATLAHSSLFARDTTRADLLLYSVTYTGAGGTVSYSDLRLGICTARLAVLRRLLPALVPGGERVPCHAQYR